MGWLVEEAAASPESSPITPKISYKQIILGAGTLREAREGEEAKRLRANWEGHKDTK